MGARKKAKPKMGGADTLFEAGGSQNDSGRNGFGYMTDLFSTFTRHISPAFNHERPDRTVQMRLYTMHKGQHLLIFIMFLCLFFIAILMGLAGPSMTMKFVMEGSKIKSPSKNKSANLVPGGPFNLLTPDLTSYQQQLWLSAQLVTKVATEQETFSKVCSVSLHVRGVGDKHTTKVIGDRVHNRTRVVR